MPVIEISFKEEDKMVYLQSYLFYSDDARMVATSWLSKPHHQARFQFSGYPLIWDYMYVQPSSENTESIQKCYYLYPFDEFPLEELAPSWCSLGELYDKYVEQGQFPPTLIMEVNGSLYVGGYVTMASCA